MSPHRLQVKRHNNFSLDLLVSISHTLPPLPRTNKMKLAIAALLAGSAAAFAPSQQGARSATQLHETKVRVELVRKDLACWL